jgi:hypothetical protein
MGFDHCSDFWSLMVLQFCEASPAVLHAAIALSSLHEHLYNKRGTVAISKSDTMLFQQYNKSIKHLRSSIQPVPITLACCILFICLENLAGNYDTALEHLKNGLKILHGWRTEETSAALEDQTREHITHVFRRLDMQATAFLDSRPPQINATSVSVNVKEGTWCPPLFASLGEAQIALERIEIRLFYVLTLKSSPEIPSYSLRNEFLPARQILLRGLVNRLTQWKRAFDVLSARENKTLQTKDLQLAVLLELHYQASSLMSEINCCAIVRANDFQFARINELSKSLISATTKATFSADMGIISPLYLSAMNATSLGVRQQAITLLRQVKWKEGFWSAETAASIAEKVLQARDGRNPENRISGGVPELAKLLCVTA